MTDAATNTPIHPFSPNYFTNEYMMHAAELTSKLEGIITTYGPEYVHTHRTSAANGSGFAARYAKLQELTPTNPQSADEHRLHQLVSELENIFKDDVAGLKERALAEELGTVKGIALYYVLHVEQDGKKSTARVVLPIAYDGRRPLTHVEQSLVDHFIPKRRTESGDTAPAVEQHDGHLSFIVGTKKKRAAEYACEISTQLHERGSLYDVVTLKQRFVGDTNGYEHAALMLGGGRVDERVDYCELLTGMLTDLDFKGGKSENLRKDLNAILMAVHNAGEQGFKLDQNFYDRVRAADRAQFERLSDEKDDAGYTPMQRRVDMLVSVRLKGKYSILDKNNGKEDGKNVGKSATYVLSKRALDALRHIQPRALETQIQTPVVGLVKNIGQWKDGTSRVDYSSWIHERLRDSTLEGAGKLEECLTTINRPATRLEEKQAADHARWREYTDAIMTAAQGEKRLMSAAQISGTTFKRDNQFYETLKRISPAFGKLKTEEFRPGSSAFTETVSQKMKALQHAGIIQEVLNQDGKALLEQGRGESKRAKYKVYKIV